MIELLVLTMIGGFLVYKVIVYTVTDANRQLRELELQQALDKLKAENAKRIQDALWREELLRRAIHAKRQTQTVKWYTFLGVAESASELEILRAYKKKAMVMHPDKGGRAEDMVRLNKAREIGLKVSRERMRKV